jgi:hypothetical protein
MAMEVLAFAVGVEGLLVTVALVVVVVVVVVVAVVLEGRGRRFRASG